MLNLGKALEEGRQFQADIVDMQLYCMYGVDLGLANPK